MKKANIRTLIRNFLIEIVIYAILVIGYFFLVLRLLAQPLKDLFSGNMTVYSFVSLALIVAQAVLLEFVTSFFVDRLGLERLD